MQIQYSTTNVMMKVVWRPCQWPLSLPAASDPEQRRRLSSLSLKLSEVDSELVQRNRSVVIPLFQLKTSRTMASILGHLDRVQSAVGSVASLPTRYVEPTSLFLRVDGTASSILHASLSAPSAVHAAHVDFRSPCVARIGCSIEFALSLNALYPHTGPSDLRVALTSLCAHVVIDASLDRGLRCRMLLAVSFALSSDGRSVIALGDIPKSARLGDTVNVRSVTVAGEPIGMERALLPARIRLTFGMQGPLRIGVTGANASCPLTPTITVRGRLYALRSRDGPVACYGPSGLGFPPLPLKALGLSSCTAVASYVAAGQDDSDSTVLLLAEYKCYDPRLVALSEATRTVLWSAPIGTGSIRGIAALPAHGVLVVSNFINSNHRLQAHRLVDGAYVSATRTGSSPSYLAADDQQGVIYACIGHRVVAYRWDEAVQKLVEDGDVGAAGLLDQIRPLAILPPVQAGSPATLVVGHLGSEGVRLVSLPDRRLVGKRSFEGIGGVLGLAADPSGEAIAVYADTGTVHVLQWPLAGPSLP
jgi:hypothetical protein